MDSPPQRFTVFMPATADRPAEPAPYVMTEADLVRLLQMKSSRPYLALLRYRKLGWLKAIQVGNGIRYLLPDVLKFLETAKTENPR